MWRLYARARIVCRSDPDLSLCAAQAPADLGWMRSVDVGIVPALHALLATEEELKVGLGLRRERAGVIVNVFGAAEEAFSYRWWRRGAEADLSAARMQERGARLWEESTRLLATLGY